MGRPVVAEDGGGAAEAVRPASPAGWRRRRCGGAAEALDSALSLSTERRAELARAAQEHVRSRYAWHSPTAAAAALRTAVGATTCAVRCVLAPCCACRRLQSASLSGARPPVGRPASSSGRRRACRQLPRRWNLTWDDPDAIPLPVPRHPLRSTSDGELEGIGRSKDPARPVRLGRLQPECLDRPLRPARRRRFPLAAISGWSHAASAPDRLLPARRHGHPFSWNATRQ